MNKIKYVIFIITIFCLNYYNVYADCSNEDLKSLKKDANAIEVTYKHLGKVETEDGDNYNNFDLTFKNVPDNFYIILNGDANKLTPTNNEIKKTYNSGTWNFEVYSNDCTEKLIDLKVKIPRFNIYSLDPLCEGIDGKDFALCGKYYEYDVGYDNFKKRVENYRVTNKIDQKSNNTNNTENKYSFDVILKKISDFIIKYRLYILITLGFILLIISIIIMTSKRRKRGVLK